MNLNSFTHLTRSRTLPVAFYLLFALPLWAQTPTDNPVLIDITTLDQLYAIRYDADGNGAPDTDVTTGRSSLLSHGL